MNKYWCGGAMAVLLMELVTGDNGHVAPRLNDVQVSHEEALVQYDKIIRDVVRMLCAGLVHGDLSEFNVLVDDQGPVIIDLPQAVDAVANNHADWMLERDVNNMREYYGQFAPELLTTQYAKEIWSIYESGKLTPDTSLTGHFDEPTDAADVDSVLVEIQEALEEEQDRLARIHDANEDD